MNILMLTQAYPRFRGDLAGTFIRALAQSLAAQGHTVHLVLPEHPQLDLTPRENNIYLHPFRYAPNAKWAEWGYAQSLWGDVKIKRKLYFLAPIVFLSARRVMDDICAREKIDVLHAHWLLPNAPMAALVARRNKIPLVVTLHGSDIFLAEKNRALRRVAQWCLRRTDAITAPSDDLLNRAQKLGARAEQLHLVLWGAHAQFPNIAPEQIRALRAKFNIGETDALVLGIGRLVYKKGFRYLIDALAHTPSNAQLLLAGDGDLRAELEAHARASGYAERVHFAGWVPHDEISTFLAASDIFAMPSVRDDAGNVDGLPTTTLDAMAARKPIVATRLAGLPQVITDGVNGLLVEEKNPRALGDAIARLARDANLRTSLGAAGYSMVAQELNWIHVAEQFVEIYSNLDVSDYSNTKQNSAKMSRISEVS
jgi:glycosyltransferase involved in cell wall biosynthesis